jgi:hypothetical protein
VYNRPRTSGKVEKWKSGKVEKWKKWKSKFESRDIVLERRMTCGV